MRSKTSFLLKDEFVENLRPLKVRVIGAGFSGILAAIRIPQKLRNIDLVVYEQNADIGGVWWLNRYPGVACDIPSHSYQFSFAPNPNWSSLYAPGKEIQQYLRDVADRFGATRFIKTSHRLESATWDEDKKQWKLSIVLPTGDVLVEECDVLISARGQLNNMRWPDLPGLQDHFRGTVMHSGDWDESYDFRHKRVAVLGNGSSSIQIVPSLQKVEGTHIRVFMRSRTWITSKFGDNAMRQLGLDPDTVTFPPELRETWSNDPDAYRQVRKVMEDDGNLIHDSSVLGTAMQQSFRTAYYTGMQQRLAARPDLFDLIVPDFAPGCRRLTPGRGYLESLMADNVEVVPAAVTGVTETGVVARRSLGLPDEEFDADVIVCATGFHVSAPPPFPVVGRGGLSLAERWADRAVSYLSVAVDGFPNLFLMFGPNSAIGFGSLTMMFEAECDYIVQLVRKLQREDYATLEPRADRVADFTAYIDAYFRDTVYLDKCRSWYRTHGGTGDQICGLWPGSPLHALEVLRSPRWEDFVYENVGGEDGQAHPLRWLGNGRSLTQAPGGDPSWYLNADQQDVPKEGRPEDDARFQARPWSY